MQQRLCKAEEEFKHLHFTIVDLLEQQEELDIEQTIFDDHKDRIGELGVRRQQLILQNEYAKEEITAPHEFVSSCRTLPAFTSKTAMF